ncbi:MAG TPA: PAS domain S-box protein [Sediminispirochaeta sp.]|nr:PAS domain S-box protein [Sediminispirochaeta sp.]
MLLIRPEDGRILDANTAAVEFYGWSRDELRRMAISDINTLSEQELRQEIENARYYKKSYFEFQHRRRDASVREVAVFSGKVLLNGRETLYTIVRDISDQLEMEKRFYLISQSMENAAIGVFQIAEEDGRVIYANKMAAKKMGYTVEELVGMRVFDFDPSFDMENWTRHRQEVRRSGGRTIESVHRRKDGSEFPVEVTVTNIHYKGQNYTFFFVIDITARKKAQAELLESLEQKEMLLREVHHRVKNNLSVINGLIHLQLDQIPDDRRLRGALLKTRDRIMVMAMIHNMLYHDQYLSRVRFDNFVQALASRLQAASENAESITLSMDTDPVFMDVIQAVPLGLIVNELLSNSLTHAFSREEGGTLGLKLKQDGEKSCVLTVWDNGRGLSEDFDLKRHSGLGLELVRILAQQLGSKILFHGGNGPSVSLTVEP